jgi:RNA polymerase sigma-70 factor (ECF subfamily)
VTARKLQQTFEALLREHQRIVFKVAAMYARDREDRNDLEQEICTQAWRSFGRYDASRAKFPTWLYRVALNVAISQLRRHSRARSESLVPLQAWHLDTVGGGTPVEEPDARVQQLHRVIGALDPLHRALMFLYLEDRSHAEIAEILGISVSNVATRIHRITHDLRQRMNENTPTGA